MQVGHAARFPGGLAFVGFGLLLAVDLAVELARVDATVQQLAQAVCFGPGALDAPRPNVADGAADGLALHLGFEHIGLRASSGHAHAQSGCIRAAQERLNAKVEGSTPFSGTKAQAGSAVQRLPTLLLQSACDCNAAYAAGTARRIALPTMPG